MRLLSLLFATLLAAVVSIAAVAETSDQPKRKSAAGSATPKPQSKAAEDGKAATPRPQKKSTPGSTPKAKKKLASEDAAEKDQANPLPASPAAKPTTPALTPTGETAAEPATPAPATPVPRAPAATLEPADLREFSEQPPRVQQLITAALELTKLNLTYTFGSADPARGGMDCSGTMYYLLRSQGFSDVARDSSGQYVWARKRAPFFAVVGKAGEGFEFNDLLPGDLMFWTGTYKVERDIPISHVMLYLGTEKKTKKRVMFGASDGRSYAGIQRWGVSVFDFKMPREGSGSGGGVDFVGYARIPGLRDTEAKPVASNEPATTPPEPSEVEPAATPAAKSTKSKSAPKSGTVKRPKKPAATN